MAKNEKINGRFYIVKEENWCLVDSLDGSLVGFETKRAAQEAATFARAYVRMHGDIDFLSFPYSITSPLIYDDYIGREREYKADKVTGKIGRISCL